MDLREFDARLKADGYQEIETQDLAARPGKGRHRHPFAKRGLVLSGRFPVTQSGDPIIYGPGQLFAVDEGELHDESVGPDGARVLVGQKFANARPLQPLG
jgi:quercetin dioxygenase-like cupin family protein